MKDDKLINIKDMKKIDKFIYIVILIMGIIAIATIFYCILMGTTFLMNTMENYYKIFKDSNMYHTFYNFSNFMDRMLIIILTFLLYISIPYLLISVYISSIYINKYKNFNGEKKKHIARILIIGTITLFLIIKGIVMFPMNSRYEIKINSKINNYSNEEVKEFLMDKIERNVYVYKIIINKELFDGYFKANIYYRDIINKTLNIGYLEDSNIIKYANDITNSQTEQSLLILTLGNILFIYFEVLLLKEFKRLSNVDITKNKVKNNNLTLSFIMLIILIINIIIGNKKKYKPLNTIEYNNNKENISYISEEITEDILYQKEINASIFIRIINRGSIVGGKRIIQVQKTTDGGNIWNDMQEEGISVNTNAKYIFLNENVGFINNEDSFITGDTNTPLLVTIDGGKNFKNSNFCFPNNIEDNCFYIVELPKLINDKLKIKLFASEYDESSKGTYYTFYSIDNGLNWNIQK